MGETKPDLDPKHVIKLTDLESIEDEPEWLREDATVRRIYLPFGLNQLDNDIYNLRDFYPCVSKNNKR